MRTLLQEALLSLIRGDHRTYDVEGAIGFIFSKYAKQPDVARLHKAIIEVDARFPWNDEPRLDEEFRSIGYLSEGEVSMLGWGAEGDMICVFHIHPLRDWVRKGQVYGYEKYLGKLASELATMGIPNVKSVRCTLKTHTTLSFDSPRESLILLARS